MLPPSTNGASSGRSVLTLSESEREALYRQVGDAMFAPSFSYDSHIKANTVNGVFVAPSYIPTDTKTLLQPPTAGSAVFSDLVKSLGTAEIPQGFDYAAHIAAMTIRTRTDLSYDDVIRLIKETGRTDFKDFDLAAHRTATSSTVGLGNTFKNDAVATTAAKVLEGGELIALPAVGSKAWDDLMSETGGAAAQPGFNYTAHIAANAIKSDLKTLSYAEMLAVIAETGRTDFKNFDAVAHVLEKSKVVSLVGRVEQAFEVAETANLKDDELAQKKALQSKAMVIGGDDNDIIRAEDFPEEKKVFSGGKGDDQINASKRDDFLIGGEGNDRVDGGDGLDVLVLDAKRDGAEIVRESNGQWRVKTATEGTDSLIGVERISFEDVSVALDISGDAGQAYRVYKAAFNRDPMAGDTAGLGFWIDKMDNDMDLIEVSARFIDSNEFRQGYGSNPTSEEFLSKLYTNVLGRQPEASGYNWWLNELNTNPEKTKAKVLADFAESAENQTGVLSLIGNGITYEPWVG